MKTNIFVLCGGKSVEHEVSLTSASAIINAIDRDKYNVYPVFITKDGVWCSHGILEKEIESPQDLILETDSTVAESLVDFLTNYLKKDERNVVFPALHGPNGEDGTVQGLLEILDIPYIGNEVLSSAVGMDKVMMKDIFARYDIPQAKYTYLWLHNWKDDRDKFIGEIERSIGYPCFVKPSKGGSSVGINRAENRDELIKALDIAFMYDVKAVVEEEIIGREMQISVVGNNYPQASVAGEFIMERRFFDYNAKYIDGKLIPVIPARLTEDLSNEMRETAVRVFKLLN